MQQESEFSSQIREKRSFYDGLLLFAPFFTLQDHLETRKKQLTYWAEITHMTLRANKVKQSSIQELSKSFEIFSYQTKGHPKRLNESEIAEIVKEMARLDGVSMIDQNAFNVNWFSPFELADAIYQWAKDQKKIGYTETPANIAQGESTDKSLKFYEVPEELIIKACLILEQTERADMYDYDGIVSVKFK